MHPERRYETGSGDIRRQHHLTRGGGAADIIGLTHARTLEEPTVTNRPQICLLGGLRIVGDESSELTFRTRKTTGLFAYLALRSGQRHSRDFLCELFWPDTDAGASRLSLRVALSSLRKTLSDAPGGEQLLRVDGDVVWIDEDCEVDASEFERRYHEAAGIDEFEERLTAIEKAVSAYAGELVPGCDEALLETERERLAEMASRLLRRKGQTLYRMKRFAEALVAAEESLKIEPSSEPGYRIAIRCEMAMGRHDDAVRRYRALESLIVAEGRTAEPKSIRLGEELIAGRVTRVEPSPAVPEQRSEIPQPLTPFFGREPEIERLSGLLIEPAASMRLITLLGLGGSGKTRLAIEIAKHMTKRGNSRLEWLALAGRKSVAEARAAIAAAFEVESGAENLSAELHRRIGDELTIIILDNLEHLLAREPDAVRELIVELLGTSPSLRILGASRLPLEVPGEMRYVVPMLEMPDSNSTAAAAKSIPAVQLFVDRAQRRSVDFELDETNVADIAEIVRRLDAMPLALELAAIWVTALSPAALVQRLTDRFELLATEEADVDARHKRLESVIEASVERLPEECLALYTELCVLPDAFPFEVARAVGDLKSPLQTAALLSVLVERAFARRERRPSYEGELYIIPECLREYGAAKLGSERRSQAMRRVASFIRETLATASEEGRTDFLKAGRELRPLMPTVEGVLAWCEAEGDPELGITIATAWPPLWSLTSRQLVGRQFLSRFLAMESVQGTLRAIGNLLAANLSVESGEILSAEPFVNELLEKAPEIPFSIRAKALGLASQINGFRLDYESVAKLRKELEALRSEAQTPEELAEVLSSLAGILNVLGENDQATELSEAAFAVVRKASDRFALGHMLAGLAFNLTCIHAMNRAEAAILESIDIARESNHIDALGHRLWIYGTVVLTRDRIQAREIWLEGLAFSREANNRQDIVWLLGNLAITDLEDQQFERAEPYLRERLRHAMALGDRGAVLQTYNLLLRIFILRQDWDLARKTAIARRRLGVPASISSIEDGWLAEQEGNREAALALFAQALELAVDDPDLSLFARLCLREPINDDVGVRQVIDRLDIAAGNPYGVTGSEIMIHAVRAVRLRHALTPQ